MISYSFLDDTIKKNIISSQRKSIERKVIGVKEDNVEVLATSILLPFLDTWNILFILKLLHFCICHDKGSYTLGIIFNNRF